MLGKQKQIWIDGWENRILPEGSLTVADECVVCVSHPSYLPAPAGEVVGRRGACEFELPNS